MKKETGELKKGLVSTHEMISFFLTKNKNKNPTGNFDLEELKVSLLWIFWRVYECWKIVYYDWGKKKKAV